MTTVQGLTTHREDGRGGKSKWRWTETMSLNLGKAWPVLVPFSTTLVKFLLFLSQKDKFLAILPIY